MSQTVKYINVKDLVLWTELCMLFSECYPNQFLSDLLSAVGRGDGIDRSTAYRVLLGTELDEKQFFERPFSKLKCYLLGYIGVL